jgi:hypothetical protein
MAPSPSLSLSAGRPDPFNQAGAATGPGEISALTL